MMPRDPKFEKNISDVPSGESQISEPQPSSVPFSKIEKAPGYHSEQHHASSQETEKTKEPTLDFFNQLVAKETHSLLGRTGVKVSRICLGTMNFGQIDEKFGTRPGQLDEDAAHKILSRFVELGGNCIDTANFFPWFGSCAGQSESIIGNWLKNIDREKVFLITKVRLPLDSTNINSGGLSRNNLYNSVHECLKRLRTSYVDLLMLDGWDETVNIFETVRHLDDLVRSGRIRYFGVCDFKGWQLQKFIDCSRSLNLHKCVCYEGEYNLLTRGCEWEVAEVCQKEKIGFIGHSPLKYGLLTDNYEVGTSEPLKGSRVEAASSDNPSLATMAVPFDQIKTNPIYTQVLKCCKEIANKRKDLNTQQIALLWALQQQFVSSVCVSVSSADELEECMSVLDKCLTWQEFCHLNGAANMKLQYPYHTKISDLAGFKFFRPQRSFEALSLITPCSMAIEERQSQQIQFTTPEVCTFAAKYSEQLQQQQQHPSVETKKHKEEKKHFVPEEEQQQKIRS